MTIDDLPPLFLRILATMLGLVWGSFLNVVIYRVPRGLSVVRPGSQCPGCGTPIKPWDNVPVLGFLWLRGRARCCGAKLSPRYPLVEAIGGIIGLAILETVIFRMPSSTSIGLAGAVYIVHFALALGLIAAAFIDLEHMFLPDTITLGGAILGLLSAPLRGMDVVDSFIGAAIGFGVVWLLFIVAYSKLRGQAGMGLGDAKLLMAAGAWFGWQGALFVLGAGAVQGSIAAIFTLFQRGKIEEPEAVRREREELRAELLTMAPDERARVERELEADPLADEPGESLGQARIAFGPFLILAMLECMLIGRNALIGWFLGVSDG
jgi:leader peptidase (prepilin peptidase)/N-methyltransferase